MSKPGLTSTAILEGVKPDEGGVGMKRLAAVFLSIFALALFSAGTISAADGSYGPWQATYQGPITAPVGVVCPFTVTAEPVREDIRVRYHYHAEALMLFGQFVGEWDVDWTGYEWDGEQALRERGESIFGWVLEGRAVQDVWIVPSRGRRDSAGSPEGEYGTTIRAYDPLLEAWLATWIGPISRARRTFVARRSGDAIVQEGQTEERYPAALDLLGDRGELVCMAERVLERRREDVAPARGDARPPEAGPGMAEPAPPLWKP